MPLKIKKTVIITGYGCNNRCQFCIDADKRHIPEKTTKEVMLELISAKGRGRSYLEIIGGEPTIRPDIFQLIKFAKKLKFKTILIATNGRMLAYEDFAQKFINAGVTSIIFSIHGHNAELHDKLTQVQGSFDQLKRGIQNVQKLGFKNIGSNTTIVKDNYRYLVKIGRFIYNNGIHNAEFIFVDPTIGGAKKNFKKIVPRISDAAPYIKKCLNFGERIGAQHWHIRYVPLCYFPEYEHRISEVYEVQHFQTEHLAPDFQNHEVENSRLIYGRQRTSRCKKCDFLARKCEGIWKEYIKHYGDKELKCKKF